MGRKLDRIKGKTVLVVEDEAMLALDLTLTLQDRGATVLGPSGSLEDAMRRLEAERPDGAILDVDLHGLTVEPLAERLDSLGIPYVMYSGHATLGKGPVEPCLHKHCEPEKLIKRLVKRLSKPELIETSVNSHRGHVMLPGQNEG